MRLCFAVYMMGVLLALPSFAEQFPAKVTRVIDGDTFDADIHVGFDIVLKKRIRMYGINTPESRTKDKQEKAKAKISTACLRDFILAGDKQVMLDTINPKTGESAAKTDKHTGKFGRVLAVVYKEGVNINDQMLGDRCHGVAYFGGRRK